MLADSFRRLIDYMKSLRGAAERIAANDLTVQVDAKVRERRSRQRLQDDDNQSDDDDSPIDRQLDTVGQRGHRDRVLLGANGARFAGTDRPDRSGIECGRRDDGNDRRVVEERR